MNLRLRRPARPALRVVGDEAPSRAVFWVLLAGTASLCLFGLVFVLSASSVKAAHTQGSAWYFFLRQLFFVAAGAAAAWVGWRVDYRKLLRGGPALVVVSLVSLALVLVPTPLQIMVKGSRRWLGWDIVSFQPSEVAKLGVILWLAGLLERRRHRLDDWKATILPALAMVGVMSALIIRQPDLGTTVLICAIAFVMLVVAGCRLDVLGLLAVPISALMLLATTVGYRRERMLAFLDPWAQAYGSGFQTLQSQVGLASGGLFGVGLGASRAKWGFLPEAHTDFIFAIIGEELGLVGCALVIALFLAVVSAGVTAGRRAPDLGGMLLAVGISAWIGIQAMINIGVTVGVLPNKGITLPFVSYGGSSLVTMMFATGVLLNIAQHPAARAVRRNPAARQAAAPARTSRTLATRR